MLNLKHLQKRDERGFTLLEILIVIVILGILAALAVPVYNAVREKAVRQEAYQQLGVVHEMQQRYYAANDTYTNSFTNLTFDPNTTAAGVTNHFDYTLTSGSATTYQCDAVRDTTVAPSGATAYRVRIIQTGAITELAS
jgi:type IV pilus assembly protein PilA